MKQKKKILILGCNSYQLPLIEEAKKTNHEVYIASKFYNEKIKFYKKNFLKIDLKNLNKIYQIAKELKIEKVASTGSDIALPALGKLNSFLNNDGLSIKDAFLVNNKILLKNFFKAQDIPTPKYQLISISKKFKINLSFPILLKRVDLSGSKGTLILKKKKDLINKNKKIINKKKFILEEFVFGKEFGAQVFFKNNNIVDIVPHGDFISSGKTTTPVGHYLPLELENKIISKIGLYASKIIKNVKVKTGFINFDFILKNQILYVLEFSLRPGGTGIPELIREATKKNFFKILLSMHKRKFNYGKKIVLPKKIYFSYLIKAKKSGILKKIRINNYFNKLIRINKVDIDYNYGQKVKKFKYGNDRIGMVLGEAHNKYFDIQKYLEKIIQVTVK